MLKQILLPLVIALMFICETAAQSPQPPDWYFNINRERNEFNKMTRQRVERGNGVLINTAKLKLSKKEKQKFEPLAEDYAAYSEFLKQPKTGLVKFLDTAICRDENKRTKNSECTEGWGKVVGNGFSFRAGEHQLPDETDLSIEGGFFISRGMRVQIMMFNMGNYPLENVLPASKSFITLNEFVCPVNIDEMVSQFRNLQNGLRVGNFYFKNSLPIAANSTYIVRSIAYKIPAASGKTEKIEFREPNRDDIIFAFRVVRKDTDGNVTLLWKELSRKDAPKLVYPEDK